MRALADRLRAAVDRDRPLALLLALSWLAAVAPLVLPRALPLADLPPLFARVAVWQHAGDPAWRVGDFYATSALPVAPIGVELPLRLLAAVLGLGAACKLLLAIYAAALPTAVLGLARRFGRSPWLALLTFPLIYGYGFSLGFVAWCAGLAAALGALALLDAALERPSAGRVGGLAALALYASACHPLAALLLAACAAPILAANRRAGTRALALAGGLVALGGGIAAATLRASAGIEGAVGPSVPGAFERPIDSANLVYHRLLLSWPGDGDELALLGLALSWVLLAVTARRPADAVPDAGRRVRDWVPEIAFLLATAGYLFLPFRIETPIALAHVNARLLGPAALFGALLVRGPIAGRRRLLLLPALAATAGYFALATAHLAAFDARAAGALRLAAEVPRGATVLTLLHPPDADPAIDPEATPFSGFHAWPLALRGGFDPHLADAPRARAIAARRLPAPPPGRPGDFRPDRHRFDYVLTHQERADGADFGAAAGRSRLVARDGAWRLYRSGP